VALRHHQSTGQNLSTVVTFGDATGGKPTFVDHDSTWRATFGAGLFLRRFTRDPDNIFLSNAQANGGFGAASE